MHIEIKKNQIIIEFNEEESHCIKQKIGNSEVENISNHIKEKLINALSLEVLEKAVMPNVGKDFNLNKIKNVTAELKKSSFKADKASAANNNALKEGIPAEISSTLKEELNVISENDAEDEITAEVGDELLSDLLDKDLLKNRQKPKKDGKS